MAFGCPVEGNIPAGRLADLVERLAQFGIHSVTLGDSTGMATPPIVEAACRAIGERTPATEVTLHFHNTRGLGLVNVMTSLGLGIDRYEAAFGGLGGCPFTPGATGNVCTEDLVYLLHELGHETGIDLDAMIGISQRVGQIFGRELPGLVAKAGLRLRRYDELDARRAVG